MSPYCQLFQAFRVQNASNDLASTIYARTYSQLSQAIKVETALNDVVSSMHETLRVGPAPRIGGAARPGARHGWAVQVDPIKPRVESAWI